MSTSVNLPLHHKVQKFSSGTDSPEWSRKKGHKMVVVVVWWFLWTSNVSINKDIRTALLKLVVVCFSCKDWQTKAVHSFIDLTVVLQMKCIMDSSTYWRFK